MQIYREDLVNNTQKRIFSVLAKLKNESCYDTHYIELAYSTLALRRGFSESLLSESLPESLDDEESLERDRFFFFSFFVDDSNLSFIRKLYA